MWEKCPLTYKEKTKIKVFTDAGKEGRQEGKGSTEDEMVGQHH